MTQEVQRCLEVVHGWAQRKLDGGQEPPWAWYQYMKLIEAIRAIKARAAVKPSGAAPERGAAEPDSADGATLLADEDAQPPA